jgi:acyl carrier protein
MYMTIDDMRSFLESALDEKIDSLQIDTDLFEELGMDSLGVVDLVVSIVRKFKVRLPDELLPSLRTPQMYIDAVNAMIQANVQSKV